MDSSLGLLAAGLSAAVNKTIEFTDDGGADARALHEETTARGKVHRERPRPFDDLFVGGPHVGLTRFNTLATSPDLRSRPPTLTTSEDCRKNSSFPTYGSILNFSTEISPNDAAEIKILIKPESREGFTLNAYPLNTVAEVRRAILSLKGLQSDDWYLLHYQRPLEDDNTLDSYGIKEGDQIDLVPKKKAGQNVFAVSKHALAPRFDFDFTNVKPPMWNSYKRGDEVYRRPYGWKRYALQVIGEFEDDDWLGGLGPRKKSSSGEWPVSYHGTSKSNAESIADTGYLLSRGERFKFGEGIYSTPDLRIAERYATEFEHGGKKYLIVLQNRVNPISLKKIKKADKVGTGEYWLNPEQSDVRPYGILIKEKKYSWLSVP